MTETIKLQFVRERGAMPWLIAWWGGAVSVTSILCLTTANCSALATIVLGVVNAEFKSVRLATPISSTAWL